MTLQIQRGTVARPQRGILYAPEGIGKSTLASQLPNPLFLDFEKGTHRLDVARLEPQTLTEVYDILKELTRDRNGFQTLVIDTIDWLEEVIIKDLLTTNKKASIEEFGYGKGHVYLAEETGRLLNLLDEVAVHLDVVMLAHSEVKRVELPDLPPFDRYQLRLAKSVGPLIKEWADWILFGNYETIVREENGRTKAAGNGRTRKLWCQHSSTADAKNRHGLAAIESWAPETMLRLTSAGVSTTPASTPAAVPAPATRKPRTPRAATAPAAAPATAPAPVPGDPVVPMPPAPEEDHVPGLDPLDPEQEQLKAHFGTNDAAITAWCLKHNRISDGQTYLQMDPATRRRALAQPEKFLAYVLGGAA